MRLLRRVEKEEEEIKKISRVTLLNRSLKNPEKEIHRYESVQRVGRMKKEKEKEKKK